MSRAAVVRVLVPVLLAVAGWRVYEVRSRLASGDADPAAKEALRAELESVPLEAGPYRGEPLPLERDFVEATGADSFSSRVYQGADGSVYRLYIAGSIGNQENFHAPSYCMPSQGWEVIEEGTRPFTAYPSSTESPEMRRLVLQKGTERMLVYYWFQAGRRIADHEFWIRAFRFVDLVLGEPLRPTVIVTLYVPFRGPVDDAERAASRFLDVIGPHVARAIGAGVEQ